MHWFTGSIPEAIGESRQKGLLFVVYVEGDNEQTQTMNSTWADPKVADTLSKERCIAIKLDHKSEACTQFSQLYPVVCIPVTYFIGENGLPLEVVGGSLSVEEFLSKANKAIEAHKKTRPNNFHQTVVNAPVLQTATVQTATGASSSAMQNSSDSTATQEQSPTQAAQVASTSSIDASPGTSQDSENSNTQEVPLQDRVERAKELLEKKRLEKEENEQQNLKRKEFDRRHVGQEVTKAKRNRDEKQAQTILSQIKEDKAKERAHREAVRQQIARDKAEREARRQIEQQAQAMTVSSSDAITVGSDTQATSSAWLVNSALHASTSHVGSSASSITLYTTYPRRELTEEDLVKSLSDLGLAPSATLVVSLKNRNAVAPSGSSSSPSDLFLLLLSPLFALINFLKTFLFGSPDQPRGAYNPTAARQDSTSPSQRPNSASVRRRVPQGEGASFRQEGGVYRFSNKDDEDDENNTWNGNSTQQM
ncbi:PREDICTED: UBX domain-containing protein 4-like [Acropora digitifera]|uniref:UBX domain-containing protein 4-like n=1 Tax=Acropora digitifera TaxID=70779 RepID=UPI00077A2261|nr:PREDICTED: UBX domain-containing protein 4-like [Acropora digitifera]